MLTDRYGLTLSTTSHRRARCLRGRCGPSAHRLSRCQPRPSIVRSRPIQGSPWPISARRAPCSSQSIFPPCGTFSPQPSPQRGRVRPAISAISKSFAACSLRPTRAALAATPHPCETWPRDALVLSLAANQGGLIGMSGLAGREQDLVDFLGRLLPITAMTGGSRVITAWRCRNSASMTRRVRDRALLGAGPA